MDPNSLNRWVLFSVAAPIFVDKSSLRLNFVSKLFVHFSFASFWVALVLFCINIVFTQLAPILLRIVFFEYINVPQSTL